MISRFRHILTCITVRITGLGHQTTRSWLPPRGLLCQCARPPSATRLAPAAAVGFCTLGARSALEGKASNFARRAPASLARMLTDWVGSGDADASYTFAWGLGCTHATLLGFCTLVARSALEPLEGNASNRASREEGLSPAGGARTGAGGYRSFGGGYIESAIAADLNR